MGDLMHVGDVREPTNARDHHKQIPETPGGRRTSQGPGRRCWRCGLCDDCRRRCWRTIGVESKVCGIMALPEGIQRYEHTQHEEPEHRVGQPPAIAIYQILD